MGLETILAVGILVIIVATAVGLGRARRKARRAEGRDPETGRGGQTHTRA